MNHFESDTRIVSSLIFIRMRRKYLLVPRSQNMVPKSRAIIVVEKKRTALYWGFLQYDRFCFQRHAKHCVKKDLECLVGK
jgi:hypothetical protein